MPLNYKEKVAASKYLRVARYDETEQIAIIEAASFPPDEKATLEGIRLRQEEAGDYFMVLQYNISDGVIGYVNATCTTDNVITHESMERHEPEGKTLVIHSVTIDERYRRKGHATFMLKAYLEAMKPYTNIRRILLLCKGKLLSFYRACGFNIVGLSPVVHGADPWFEMAYDIVGSRRLRQYVIDAFTTTKPFSGNPAAVVMGIRSEKWMQQLAMENNLAETSFVEPVLDEVLTDKEAMYHLRWFTPSIEVDLCGHATLAAAHALFESGEVGSGSCGNELIDTIRFKSRSRGILTATRQKQNGKVSIELDFPAQLAIPSTLSPLEMSSVCTGFGIKSEDILFVGRSIDDLVIRVSPEVFYRIPTLASGQLDVVKVALMQQRKVIFTCTGPLRYVDDFCAHANAETQALMATHNHDIPTQPYPFPTDFLSRCFATRYGISEDPVTGSAHTALAPYWCQVFFTDRLIAFQHSARGGLLYVKYDGDRVMMRGESVTVMKSVIQVEEGML